METERGELRRHGLSGIIWRLTKEWPWGTPTPHPWVLQILLYRRRWEGVAVVIKFKTLRQRGWTLKAVACVLLMGRWRET